MSNVTKHETSVITFDEMVSSDKERARRKAVLASGVRNPFPHEVEPTKPSGLPKNRRPKICTRFGLEWEGFKVPKGAIFGCSDNIPYVMTKIPENPGTKAIVWMKTASNRWVERIIHVQFDIQLLINYELGLSTNLKYVDILNNIACKVLPFLKENPTKIEGWRDLRSQLIIANSMPKRKAYPQPMPLKQDPKPLDGRVNSHGFTEVDPKKIPDSKNDPEPYWATFNKDAKRRYVTAPLVANK